MDRSFCPSGRLDQVARSTELPSLLEKFGCNSAEENRKMHARPQIRELLLAKKMQHWALIGRNPTAFPNVSPTRARRNYSRLYARYPEIAQKLRMTAVSAYPPI
jgi:hypothetical protein